MEEGKLGNLTKNPQSKVKANTLYGNRPESSPGDIGGK